MRLKDVAYINRHVLPDSTNPDYSFRYIDISAVDDLGSIAVPDELTRFENAPSRARRIAPAGCTVISTVRTYLRAIAQVPVADSLIFSTGFAVIEPKIDTDGRFLAYACRSQPFIDEVVARSVGVSYPAINPSDLACIAVPALPRDEQHRIADFLDAETARMDSLFSAQMRAQGVLLERRAANVFEAVTGRAIADRMSSNLAWVESIPTAWQSVKLGQFARMGSGHTPSRLHPEWWDDCKIPWVTTGEVSQMRNDRLEVLTETRERISEIGLAHSAAELHPEGTVVLCRTAASAGYSAVIGQDMATSQDIVTWTCGPKLDPFYLLWCLRAMRTDLLGRLAMGSTHKTIYMPDLQALRIPLPSLDEQRQIVESIRASNSVIDAAVDSIDRQLSLLAERRQALITAAVTGAISV